MSAPTPPLPAEVAAELAFIVSALFHGGVQSTVKSARIKTPTMSKEQALSALTLLIAKYGLEQRIATMHDYQVKRTAHRLIEGANADGEIQFVNSYIKDLEAQLEGGSNATHN